MPPAKRNVIDEGPSMIEWDTKAPYWVCPKCKARRQSGKQPQHEHDGKVVLWVAEKP